MEGRLWITARATRRDRSILARLPRFLEESHWRNFAISHVDPRGRQFVNFCRDQKYIHIGMIKRTQSTDW